MELHGRGEETFLPLGEARPKDALKSPWFSTEALHSFTMYIH
jgi:hypothetical protein